MGIPGAIFEVIFGYPEKLSHLGLILLVIFGKILLQISVVILVEIHKDITE